MKRYFEIFPVCLFLAMFLCFPTRPVRAGGPDGGGIDAPETEEAERDEEIGAVAGPDFETGGHWIKDTPFDPGPGGDPTDDPEPTGDDGEEEDAETSNQWIEIVLNQSLLDTLTRDVIPAFADGLGLNGERSLVSLNRELDVGKCHHGSYTIYDIVYHLPVSEESVSANFAAGAALETSWDFSEASYVTAKLLLDAPRQALGHGATDDDPGCELWEWILMGDLRITADIELTGIAFAADFSLGAVNSQVHINAIGDIDTDFDATDIEIDDLEGGGVLKLLVDMGIGIESGDFECAAHSSFEACLEARLRDELVGALEGDDIKDSLKEALNSALAASLAVKDSEEIGDGEIGYSFSLIGMESTPDGTGLVTEWAAFLTDYGARDSCAVDVSYEKDIGEVTEYEAKGSMDAYLPLWIVEQTAYFIGKWGYFCLDESFSASVRGHEVSYGISVKPAGPLSVGGNSHFSPRFSGKIDAGATSFFAKPTDETLEEIPGTDSAFPFAGAEDGVKGASKPGRSGAFPFMDSEAAAETSASKSDENGTDAEDDAFEISLPVNLALNGDVSGAATATLKVKAEIRVNDEQGLNLRILSAKAEDLSGSMTVSVEGVEKSIDVSALDLGTDLAGAFKKKFKAVDVPLLPRLSDFSAFPELRLSVGEIGIVESAAIKVPVTVEAR